MTLADENGNPLKVFGLKDMLQPLQKFFSVLPNNWAIDVVIIDSMFLINTKPLPTTQSMVEYSKFLFVAQ